MIGGNAFGYQPYDFSGLSGPSGFTGMNPMLGQSLLMQMQQPQQPDPQHGHHGMNPLMFLSPLMAAFGSGHTNLGLGMINPALGIARALGAFK